MGLYSHFSGCIDPSSLTPGTIWQWPSRSMSMRTRSTSLGNGRHNYCWFVMLYHLLYVTFAEMYYSVTYSSLRALSS